MITRHEEGFRRHMVISKDEDDLWSSWQPCPRISIKGPHQEMLQQRRLWQVKGQGDGTDRCLAAILAMPQMRKRSSSNPVNTASLVRMLRFIALTIGTEITHMPFGRNTLVPRW